MRRLTSYVLIILLLTLFLVACGGGATDEPVDITPSFEIAGTSLTLTGQFENRSRANQMLSAFVGNNNQLRAEASIGSDSEFTISVNGVDDFSDAQSFGVVCNPNIDTNVQNNVSISNATSSHLLRLTANAARTHLSSFSGFNTIFNVPTGVTATNVGFYYFSDAAVVSGQESCQRANLGLLTVNYDLDIKQGWNSLVLTLDQQSDSLTISGEIADIPSNVAWYAGN